jgi:replication fork clamp-binding protein CrfC
VTDAEKAQMLRDEIAQLTTILDAEGYMAKGYKGQPVAHPALAQRRASLRVLYAIEARIAKTDDLDDELDAFLSEV